MSNDKDKEKIETIKMVIDGRITRKEAGFKLKKSLRQIDWLKKIYLEEGEAGFYIERRGRTKKVDNPNKGRPRKKPLGKKIREDIIAENQRLKEENQYLKAEMEYLKKLDALIRAEEQKNGKNRK